MKTNDLIGWQAFIAVARYGNYANASRELRVPVSILSKRVTRLEEQIGVRLFHRSTRVVSLTNEGLSILPKIKTLFDDLEEIETVFSQTKELVGTIRITCVPFIAHNLLLPIIKEFIELHPKVKIDLSLGEKFINLIESNIDLAIRIQTPQNSDLIYRKLAPNDLVFCATPKYLKENPPLKSLEDLEKHNLLFLKIHESVYFKDTQVQLKKFSAQKKIDCDSGAFLIDLALNNVGIMVRSVWDLKEHFKTGSLVQVLKKYPLETFGHIHAVIPCRKFLAPRVRTFYEFVIDKSKKW